MAFSDIKQVRITGLSACVPKTIEENNNLSILPADEAEKLISSIGIERKRKADRSICSSDLCYGAADQLIKDLGWNRDEIDCLIFVSQTPDYYFPATSCTLQDRLGLTLPIVDGFMWSTPDDRAGLRFIQLNADGSKKEILLNNPVVTETNKKILQVQCEDNEGNSYKIIFHEDHFEVSCSPVQKKFNWALELKTAPGKELPFRSFEKNAITAEFSDFNYRIACKKGSVKKAEQPGDFVFQLIPASNKLVVDCTNKLD